MSASGNVGSKDTCICNFDEYCQTDFIEAIPIYTPIKSVQKYPFPHNLPTKGNIKLLKFCQSDR